eukprot:Sspe_Gene.3416::Locus_1128_Transcript_1_1_Confidence_1.000_Length_1031::g.3416::m.3416
MKEKHPVPLFPTLSKSLWLHLSFPGGASRQCAALLPPPPFHLHPFPPRGWRYFAAHTWETILCTDVPTSPHSLSLFPPPPRLAVETPPITTKEKRVLCPAWGEGNTNCEQRQLRDERERERETGE